MGVPRPTGGSFRHFLWQVCKELQSSSLCLLLLCPSAAVNKNKVRCPRPGHEAPDGGGSGHGTCPHQCQALAQAFPVWVGQALATLAWPALGHRFPGRSRPTSVSCLRLHFQGKYILTPSPITCGEEQLLHFLGQLLGIAIRADVPLPLDLLPSFWKTLVGEPLDPDQDLQEADILTYNYVKKFESVSETFLLGDSRAPEQCPWDPYGHLCGLGHPSSPTKDW